MATKGIRKSAEEKLSDSNIAKVITLLEAEKPITKKEACAILNIKYNTSRLGDIIEQYKVKATKDAEQRAKKRGKPATEDEISYILQAYLEGNTIDSISDRTYRSADFVKQILNKHACPIRARSHNYFKPELIPEEAMRMEFKVGDTVYSARYDSVARIDKEVKPGIYRIWLKAEKWLQFAYQEAAELASLEHMQKLGVKF